MSPADAGLDSGGQRRARGLRREELAELANLSVDYIIRLEQGRATAPSSQVVGALARALRLTSAEQDHFYRLARLQPPEIRMIDDQIAPNVRRLLSRLGDIPIAVFAADWRLIWWNRGWEALLGDPRRFASAERSLVASRFPIAGRTGGVESYCVRSQNPDATDRAVVADLRRATSRYPDDARLAAVITRTLAGNARFAELWQAGCVGAHVEDHKTIEHPIAGEITVDCDVLSASDTDLKIVTMTAPGDSSDAAKLRSLIKSFEPIADRAVATASV